MIARNGPTARGLSPVQCLRCCASGRIAWAGHTIAAMFGYIENSVEYLQVGYFHVAARNGQQVSGEFVCCAVIFIQR